MAEYRDFHGLVTNADPHDHSGAVVQENCMALSPGKLQGRGGLREVWFDNATARGGGAVSDITTLPDLVALASFRRPDADYIVFLDATGNVMVGRAPA